MADYEVKNERIKVELQLQVTKIKINVKQEIDQIDEIAEDIKERLLGEKQEELCDMADILEETDEILEECKTKNADAKNKLSKAIKELKDKDEQLAEFEEEIESLKEEKDNMTKSACKKETIWIEEKNQLKDEWSKKAETHEENMCKLQKKIACAEQINKSEVNEKRLIDEIERLKGSLKNARCEIQDPKGCKREMN